MNYLRTAWIAICVVLSASTTSLAVAKEDDTLSRIPSIETLTQKIKENPDALEYYYLRGHLYQQEKKFAQAVADYTKLIDAKFKIDGFFADKGQMAYGSRAVVYMQMKNFDAALADLNKGLSIAPNDAMMLANRGAAYLEKKQYALAMNDDIRALKIDPKQPTAYEGIGEIYYKTKQYARAMQYLNSAIMLNSKDPDAYYYRGATQKALGRNVEAQRDFERAEKLGFKLGETTIMTVTP
ncbi:MAG: tetratricopeptide repeat protein [Candidatus Melainabacteria bacterium]|nr:MAG: tetratricopeptide repeat protein [Candidatus Melainabacteria bacterium]